MQQLYEQVAQRWQRVQQVLDNNVVIEQFRKLKQEEKLRYEKENFILSMMKANKNSQVISKNTYYKYSYEIMKKINPFYVHNYSQSNFQENFLNYFVGLYRQFFYKYEEMFNFKLKIQSLIRPTNHNLVIDLIRYLVDFSRDYYQQTFFWQMKSATKMERIQQENSKDLSENDNPPLNNMNFMQKKKQNHRVSLNESLLTKVTTTKSTDESESPQKRQLQKQPQKHYDILEISGLPSLSYQQKDSNTNVQVLKIRLNEIYREVKSRNLSIKASYSQYYNEFHGNKIEKKQKDVIQYEDFSLNKACFPFRLTLVFEKNGFNFINVMLAENKNYIKKQKKLAPIRGNERFSFFSQTKGKQDFLLSSLKIIRVSQNCLPPLSTPGTNNFQQPNRVKVQFFPRFGVQSSQSTSKETSSNPKINFKKDSTRHNVESYTSIKQQRFVIKQYSSKRLGAIKKNFKSEDMKKKKQTENDPEEKINHWLSKLRQIKQIERRKAMGL